MAVSTVLTEAHDLTGGRVNCALWEVPVCEGFGDLALLDAAERERYRRFVDDGARAAFRTSRIAVRLVLADCLGISPHDVEILRTSPGGGWTSSRPVLRGGEVDFSVSHSRERVVVAVVATGRVGVDIEPWLGAGEAAEIAGAMAGPAEGILLASLDADVYPHVVTRWWCRKEAFLKLIGVGLFMDPALVDVREGRLLPPKASSWGGPVFLRDIDDDSHATAIASSPNPVSVTRHHL